MFLPHFFSRIVGYFLNLTIKKWTIGVIVFWMITNLARLNRNHANSFDLSSNKYCNSYSLKQVNILKELLNSWDKLATSLDIEYFLVYGTHLGVYRMEG
jgi:hypothetical protein